MNETNKQEKFEKRKNELKKYLESNPIPTESNNARFEDGVRMGYFLRAYKEKLLEDKEFKKIIETKINDPKQQHVKKIENAISNARELIPLINTLEFRTKSDLYKQLNTSQNSFNSTMNTLKKYEPELYQQMENLIEAGINRVIEPNDEILNLLESLKESEKNETKFNIIDYINTTDISLQELQNIVDKLNLSNEDKRIIRLFISQYLRSSFKINQRRQNLTSLKYTIRDKNGNMVTVPQEENEYIADFMEEYNIPLIQNTFDFILKGYINGEINLEEIRKNKSKKK